MKKVAFLMIAMVIFSSVVIAQDKPKKEKEEYPALRELYEARKFDKLEFKAYNLMASEKHHKHPLPYLYLSLANYELAKLTDEKSLETFPRAAKDAVKYAISFKRKDKKGNYAHLYPDHIKTIEKDILTEAEGHYTAGNYKKARTSYKRLVRLTPQDPDAWLSKTLCEVQLKLKTDAKLSLEKATALKNMQDSYEKLSVDQKELLKEYLAYNPAGEEEKSDVELDETEAPLKEEVTTEANGTGTFEN
jgi:tetratricopeptide (TPR) repeat protein